MSAEDNNPGDVSCSTRYRVSSPISRDGTCGRRHSGRYDVVCSVASVEGMVSLRGSISLSYTARPTLHHEEIGKDKISMQSTIYCSQTQRSTWDMMHDDSDLALHSSALWRRDWQVNGKIICGCQVATIYLPPEIFFGPFLLTSRGGPRRRLEHIDALCPGGL